MSLVGIVIGAVERLLKAPVEFHLGRGGFLQNAKLLQRRVHGTIGKQRPSPISFQCQESLSEIILKAIADEISTVLPQDVDDFGVRIPAQAAPENLVDIVIAAFGIADEAD